MKLEIAGRTFRSIKQLCEAVGIDYQSKFDDIQPDINIIANVFKMKPCQIVSAVCSSIAWGCRNNEKVHSEQILSHRLHGTWYPVNEYGNIIRTAPRGGECISITNQNDIDTYIANRDEYIKLGLNSRELVALKEKEHKERPAYSEMMDDNSEYNKNKARKEKEIDIFHSDKYNQVNGYWSAIEAVANSSLCISPMDKQILTDYIRTTTALGTADHLDTNNIRVARVISRVIEPSVKSVTLRAKVVALTLSNGISAQNREICLLWLAGIKETATLSRNYIKKQITEQTKRVDIANCKIDFGKGNVCEIDKVKLYKAYGELFGSFNDEL
jgi:hypothetical protein